MNDDAGSFARRAIALAQLAGAANLILGFGIAAIGFLITVLMNVAIDAGDRWQVVAYLLFLASMLLFLVSVAIGGWLTVIRLRDARAPMHGAQTVEQATEDRQTERRRKRTARLENRSWRLFWWQMAVFGLALTTGAAAAALIALRWIVSGDMPDNGCNI